VKRAALSRSVAGDWFLEVDRLRLLTALFILSLLLVSIPVLANEPTPIQREEAFVEKHGVAGSRFTTSAQISAEIAKVGKDLRDAVVAFDLKACADPASASENDRAKALILAMEVKSNGNKLGFLLIIHRRMYEMLAQLSKQHIVGKQIEN
jgi:hypothetical protein